MTSVATNYTKEWHEKLFKNKDEEYSFIEFFGNIRYDLDPLASDKKTTNMLKLAKGLITADEMVNAQDNSQVYALRKIWVEGTRDSFAMYMYNDAKETNHYFRAAYYTSTKYYAYSVDTKKKTFYALKYYKGIPIIECLDSAIPKKYFILEGEKFAHTNDIEKAMEQSLKNFYFFKDEITDQAIKDYIAEQERIRQEKLAAEKMRKMMKIGGIILAILLILFLVYWFVIRKSKKNKKSSLVDYADYDEEEYDEEDE